MATIRYVRLGNVYWADFRPRYHKLQPAMSPTAPPRSVAGRRGSDRRCSPSGYRSRDAAPADPQAPCSPEARAPVLGRPTSRSPSANTRANSVAVGTRGATIRAAGSPCTCP